MLVPMYLEIQSNQCKHTWCNAARHLDNVSNHGGPLIVAARPVFTRMEKDECGAFLANSGSTAPGSYMALTMRSLLQDTVSRVKGAAPVKAIFGLRLVQSSLHIGHCASDVFSRLKGSAW